MGLDHVPQPAPVLPRVRRATCRTELLTCPGPPTAAAAAGLFGAGAAARGVHCHLQEEDDGAVHAQRVSGAPALGSACPAAEPAQHACARAAGCARPCPTGSRLTCNRASPAPAARSYAIDGCATFFKRDRFALVKKYEVSGGLDHAAVHSMLFFTLNGILVGAGFALVEKYEAGAGSFGLLRDDWAPAWVACFGDPPCSCMGCSRGRGASRRRAAEQHQRVPRSWGAARRPCPPTLPQAEFNTAALPLLHALALPSFLQ